MARRMVKQLQKVSLTDYRKEIESVLQKVIESSGFFVNMDFVLSKLANVIQRSLDLEAVGTDEVFEVVKEVLENTKLCVSKTGNDLLQVTMLFPSQQQPAQQSSVQEQKPTIGGFGP